MTAQFPDWLVYRDRRRALYSNPLESYWNEQRPRPDWPAQSSGCWRGYVAHWLLKHQRLYLTNIERPFLPIGIDLQDVFPEQPIPVSADWYSGQLRLPDGEQLRYVHMGYASVFATETFMGFWRGQLVYEEEFDQREQVFRKRSLTNAVDQLFGEEAGFLRGIYGYPDDLAPKLIYADWLEEHEDERATLLRAFLDQPNEAAPDRSLAEAPIGQSWLWWHLLGG